MFKNFRLWLFVALVVVSIVPVSAQDVEDFDVFVLQNKYSLSEHKTVFKFDGRVVRYSSLEDDDY